MAFWKGSDMRKRLVLAGVSLFLAALLLAACQAAPAPRPPADEQDRVLAAAERTFLLLGRKDYRAVWDSISRRSRDAIVQDVLKACRALTVSCDRQELLADFAAGGPAAIVYWENYLANFDPNAVLRDSWWSIGAVRLDEAEIIVRHRDAGREAILRIIREDGAWKMGLEESFGVRKWMQW